jgi:SPX domain protein involved in polyphosphate accumulation
MRRWTEGDEAAFVKRLEKELLKCERFQVGKVSTVWDAMRWGRLEMGWIERSRSRLRAGLW